MCKMNLCLRKQGSKKNEDVNTHINTSSTSLCVFVLVISNKFKSNGHWIFYCIMYHRGQGLS